MYLAICFNAIQSEPLSPSVAGILNFCANNYLGLSSHPEVVKAGIDALHSHGAGLSSVRFICGTQVPLVKQRHEYLSKTMYKGALQPIDQLRLTGYLLHCRIFTKTWNRSWPSFTRGKIASCMLAASTPTLGCLRWLLFALCRQEHKTQNPNQKMPSK